MPLSSLTFIRKNISFSHYHLRQADHNCIMQWKSFLIFFAVAPSVITAPSDKDAKRSAYSDSFLVETKLCDSKITFSQPQRMKSVDNKVRTIVNHLNFTQLVRFEYCSSENFPCTYNIYPKTIQSHCQQKYMLVKLVAFDDDNSCLMTEKFLVPSSCDCMIATEDFIKGVKEDLITLSWMN